MLLINVNDNASNDDSPIMVTVIIVTIQMVKVLKITELMVILMIKVSIIANLIGNF